MPRLRTYVAAVTCGVFVLMVAGPSNGGTVAEQDGSRLELATRRGAASDLEIRGLAKGPRFVSRNALLALPQVEALAKRDENFTEMPMDGARVRGVEFAVLMRALGVGAAARAGRVALKAVCSDGYSPAFPPEYLRQHHPILVLTVEGLEPSVWAAETHTGDLGPYFVAYSNFVPAFRVLSHKDRPQLPVEMVRLEMATPERMFGAITPSGSAKRKGNSQVMQGFQIAQQNCFRCHSASGYGGTGDGPTKSGRDWQYLAGVAKKQPERFAAWVHNPQAMDAKATMPPNLDYDRDTLTALTRYFSAFSDRTSNRATSLSSGRGD